MTHSKLMFLSTQFWKHWKSKKPKTLKNRQKMWSIWLLTQMNVDAQIQYDMYRKKEKNETKDVACEVNREKRAKKLNSFCQMTKLCVMSKRLGYHLYYICWISANVCHHWSFHHLMFSRISKNFNFSKRNLKIQNVGHQM